MDEQDLLIDAALDELPLSPTPPGFTRAVMAEVWKPALTFRLEFLDFALPAFFALFGAMILAGALAVVTRLDPVRLMQLQLSVKLLLARLASPALLPVEAWLLAGGACLSAGAVAVLAVVLGASQVRREA